MRQLKWPSRGRHRIREEEWRTEVNKTLLKVFLTDPGRTFPHDELIECLWPETDHPSRQARNLRARVCELRRILDPSLRRRGFRVIRTTRGGYRLDPDPTHCWVDFLEMRGLFEQGRTAEAAGTEGISQAIDLYKRAAALYRGEFLPEDRHREWTQPLRDQLRGLHREVLARLVRLLAQHQGREEEAIEYAEQGLLADPYDEAFYRALMHLYNQTGRPALALRTYERCVRALSELGLEPSAETQQLAETIRGASRPRRPGARPQQPPAVGAADADEDEEARRLLEEAAEVLYRDPARAVRLAREARKLFQAEGDPLGEAQALQTQANAELQRSNLDGAERALCEAQRRLARRKGNAGDAEEERSARVRMALWSTEARVHEERQRYERALACYDRALQLAEAQEFFDAQATLLLNLGAFHYEQGRLGEAGLHWDRARVLARRLGLTRVEAKASNNLALLRKQGGDLEGAKTLYERAIELLEPLEDWRGLADAWNNLGVVEEILGRLGKAEAA